tara:strand:+ start:113 stop:1027 length:915 start_codon:yes stop_codon:yes gene_type:complete
MTNLTNHIYKYDPYLRYGRPSTIVPKIRITPRSVRLKDTDPVAYYDLHPDDSSFHLVRFIQSNKVLFDKILELYKKIESNKGYGSIYDVTSRGASDGLLSCQNIVNTCIKVVACRKTALINVIMEELLAKKDFTFLVFPIKNLISDKENELANFKRLFWYGKESNMTPDKKLYKYKPKDIVVFQRYAAKTFEIIEDWFIEISSLSLTKYKSPLVNIWRRGNVKDLEMNSISAPSTSLEDDFKTIESLNLSLLKDTAGFGWGKSDIYGPVPNCQHLGIKPPEGGYGNNVGLPVMDQDYEYWKHNL